ncbi:MAG: hypothetical protein J6V44_16535 [Methanobrevibacter sp.]|nr:hypothetical protein [Methanobrevibacter sp.]MBO7691990.1 hypothetical protein [Methanobrevibacter sp.]
MNQEKKINYKKCYAVTGFNSKQVWVYDDEHDVYIDPPKCVIDEIEGKTDSFDEQESLLDEIIKTDPDWLQDEAYTYDGETTDI